MKYLALDVEAGGITPDRSILEVYFGVVAPDGALLDELSILTKPDNGPYIVDAQALSVNKIDLVQHDKNAVTYQQAGRLIYDFLNKNSSSGKDRLIPLGHNVGFDVDFVQAHLISKKTWNQFCSYRTRCTGVISGVLTDLGIIPSAQSSSLSSLCNFFHVPIINAHRAKDDAIASANLYFKMLHFIKRKP
jgi:DNA polymerase III alpha subunit (gram-positive type)